MTPTNPDCVLRIVFRGGDSRLSEWQTAFFIPADASRHLSTDTRTRFCFAEVPYYIDDADTASRQLVLAHHGTVEGANYKGKGRWGMAGEIRRPYYYQHASGTEAFFGMLLSTSPQKDSELARLLLYQMTEAALLNVVIVDERIAQVLATARAPDEPGILLAEKLYWMGIRVASEVKVNDKKVWSYDMGKAEKRCIRVNFSFNDSISPLMSIEPKEEEEKLPVHIMLIHATRLLGIRNRMDKVGLDELVEAMRGEVKHVVVHSGRGRTEGDIPKNAPFIEYSTIQRYILQEPSKFHLTQVVMAAKGGLE